MLDFGGICLTLPAQVQARYIILHSFFCFVLKLASKTAQTTLGRTLASMLDVPYISLDALYWQPNWKETPVVEFRAKVAHAMEKNPDGWIVDGEYGRRLGNVVQEAASDIICTTSSVCRSLR